MKQKYFNLIILFLLVFISCSKDEYIEELDKEKPVRHIKTDTIYEEIPSIPYTSENLEVYIHSIHGDSNSKQIAANDTFFIESKNNRKIKAVKTDMELWKCMQIVHTTEKRAYWCADTVEIKPIIVTLTFTHE